MSGHRGGERMAHRPGCGAAGRGRLRPMAKDDPTRPDRNRRFEDKVVFISGAARGQGRSHAVGFAREGARIIGVDICSDLEHAPYPGATEEDLAETVRQVESVGFRCCAD